MTDFLARVKLLYNKLENRGHSGKILNIHFLKVCSKYAVCIKYGVTDGKSLWLHDDQKKTL